MSKDEKKTLYVHRPLLNGKDIVKWAKEQGFEKTLEPEDMHVTITFSKSPVDWSKFTPNTGTLHKPSLGKDTSVVPLGDEGAVVLKFSSNVLAHRHKEFLAGGCSHDWPEYQSHVTISYNGKGVDLKNIKPYRGKLSFGPEVFKEIDLDWKNKVKEK